MRLVETAPHRYGQLAGRVALAGLMAFAPAALAARQLKGPEAAAKFKADGDSLKSAGKIPEAVKAYKNAFEADSNNSSAGEDIGKALFTMGQYKEAAEVFQSLTSDDKDPASMWNLAYTLRKTGDYKNAAVWYVRYIKVLPDDADAYYSLAECFRQLKQYPDAAKAYDLYVQKETRPSESDWVAKAKTKSASMASLAGGAQVVAMPGATPAPATPSPAPAASQPVNIPLASNSTPAPAPAPAPIVVPVQAPVMQVPISTRDPNAAIAKIREGDVLFKQGRYREALFSYQDAIKLDDQSTNALLKEGLAYANMSYFKQAIEKWQHVLDIDPKNAYAPKYIAKAQPHVDQSGGGDINAVQPVQATNLLAQPASTGALAGRPVSLEDEAAAKDSYRKAVQLMNSQQYGDAITVLGAAIQKNPNYTNAYIARGGANFGLHKYSEAVSDYQTALQMNTNLATPLYGLGRAYQRLGDKANACTQYRKYAASTAVDVQPNLKKQAQDQLTALCGG